MSDTEILDAPELDSGRLTDGRRQRSAESRRRILEAMLALVLEGNPEPGAEAVALRAGVGLRTVFRLFSDMESVCAEMLVPQRQEFVDLFTLWFGAPVGPESVRGFWLQLCALYERRMPLRRAAVIRRYSSASLAAAIHELDVATANFLERHLPGEAAKPSRDMLSLLMSYEAWMRLRDNQALDEATARATLLRAIEPILAACGDKARVAAL